METAFAIRKFPLAKAKRYLEDVMVHKQAIPFHCTNGHVKCAFFILDLLNNAESNDEIKGLYRCSLAGRISHPSQAKAPDLP